VTPRGLLLRAGLIALVYVSLHLLGARGMVAFLSGTPVGGSGAILLGVTYLLFHFLFVLVTPILILAAGLLMVKR
jgi:hypothetical protein